MQVRAAFYTQYEIKIVSSATRPLLTGDRPRAPFCLGFNGFFHQSSSGMESPRVGWSSIEAWARGSLSTLRSSSGEVGTHGSLATLCCCSGLVWCDAPDVLACWPSSAMWSTVTGCSVVARIGPASSMSASAQDNNEHMPTLAGVSRYTQSIKH